MKAITMQLGVLALGLGMAWSVHAAGEKPQKPAAVTKAANTPARAESPQEQEVRRAVEQVVTGRDAIDSVRKVPYGNLYEVLLSNGELAYADAAGSFLIAGSLIDLKTKRNVSADRNRELQQINVADLPLADAVKQVRGNGKRVLVTFEDPNCGYCKKLVKDLVNLKDTTVYTFLTPILTPDSAEKSKSIWCSTDRAKAWGDWMVEAKAPTGPTTCDTPIARNLELQRKLRITGTPTMFLADGSRIGGYMALPELEKSMQEAADKVAPKK